MDHTTANESGYPEIIFKGVFFVMFSLYLYSFFIADKDLSLSINIVSAIAVALIFGIIFDMIRIEDENESRHFRKKIVTMIAVLVGTGVIIFGLTFARISGIITGSMIIGFALYFMNN